MFKSQFPDFAGNIQFKKVFKFLGKSSTWWEQQAAAAVSRLSLPITLQQECLPGPASAVHGGHPQLQTNKAKAKTKSVSPQVRAVLRLLVLNRLHRRLQVCSPEMCYSCRTVRFVGVWSSLSMSAGYKLSLMKEKETKGNPSGPADPPNSSTHFNKTNREVLTQSSKKTC